jgi:hypothetical protein
MCKNKSIIELKIVILFCKFWWNCFLKLRPQNYRCSSAAFVCSQYQLTEQEKHKGPPQHVRRLVVDTAVTDSSVSDHFIIMLRTLETARPLTKLGQEGQNPGMKLSTAAREILVSKSNELCCLALLTCNGMCISHTRYHCSIF